MNDLAVILKQTFKDKDYRHGYVDDFLNAYIATQIKVLREQRGWSQKELADHAGMMQPRISVLENVNYSSWSIKILRKIAEAFDLTLCVSFENFGSRLEDIEKFSRNNLERCFFDDDPYFKESTIKEPALVSAAAAIMWRSHQPAYNQAVGQEISLGTTAAAATTIPAVTLKAVATVTGASANIIDLVESTKFRKDAPKTVTDYYGNNPPVKREGIGAISAISQL